MQHQSSTLPANGPGANAVRPFSRSPDAQRSAVPADRHPGLVHIPGLPIPSTEPLTHAEREAVRTAARVCRLLADRFEEALAAGRVDRALEATQLAGAAGVRVQQLRELLGSAR